MPWAQLVMAGLGAATKQREKDEQTRQRAEEIRYSPWSGIGVPTQITSKGAAAGALEGFGAGNMLSKNMQQSDASNQLLQGQGQSQPGNSFPVIPASNPNSVYASRGTPWAASPGPWAQGNKYSGWGG